MKCQYCDGHGKLDSHFPCPECNGTGIAYCCEGDFCSIQSAPGKVLGEQRADGTYPVALESNSKIPQEGA